MLNKLTVISILVLLVVYYYGRNSKNLGKIVNTKSGAVQGGIVSSREGREFHEWLGIPYAEKPQRWTKPEPKEKWEGVRDATSDETFCAQIDPIFFMSQGVEDCLVLNIFAPKDIEEGKLLPVILFIHGGYFAGGASHMFRGEYFMDFDVVFVTINYRVGALGFLSTGEDGIIRGNYGLQDQHLALKWVNQNIENFGGDKNNVVISGNSAGGVSVQHHILYEKNKGLFKGAISQSGSVLNPWALTENPKEQAIRFGKMVGCPTENSKEMVDCLRKAELSEIINGHRAIRAGVHGIKDLFLPTVESIVDEDTFLREHPLKLLKAGKFNKVPFITGVTENEGLLLSHYYFDEKFRKSAQNEWNSGFAETEFILSPQEAVHAQKIREFYFGNDTRIDTIDAFPQITKIYGDRWFISGVTESAVLYAEKADTYLYVYRKSPPSLACVLFDDPKTSFPLVNAMYVILGNWIKTNVLGMAPHNYGVGHGDDTLPIFYIPLLSKISTESPHFQFSKDLVKLWVDFAYGKLPLKFRNKIFPKLNPREPTLKFFEIQDEPTYTERTEINERLKFWESLKK